MLLVVESEYDFIEHLDVVSELNMAVPDDDKKSMKLWVGRARKIMKPCEPNAAFSSRILLNKKAREVTRK